ncbi:MAG: SMP-30/gluconolactonase/LRE family protein [Betaproteobacteria bacterium]|nr:SMP-30/gluconolactonase/LRE family protein [Betaproteobacteria bacterium]
MYFGPPPGLIETEIFTTLPDKFRDAAKASASKRRRRNFLEGPSFDRAGNLYCVDIPMGRVYRISPRGEWEIIVEYEGEPNGLKIDKEGRIFIADHRNGILLLDGKAGKVTPFLEGPGKQRFKGVNDLIFAQNGDLYFTDQGQTGLHDPTGCVYRYTPSGRLDCLVNTIPSPNGLVFNVRETSLFVAVTRANAVWRIPLDDTGVTSKVGLFVQLFSAGPDGLALDADGNVVVTHPGLGIVWLFSKRGVPLYNVKSCAGEMTTNVAYGGEDRKTLYIVDSAKGNILTARMPVAGKLMYSHA